MMPMKSMVELAGTKYAFFSDLSLSSPYLDLFLLFLFILRFSESRKGFGIGFGWCSAMVETGWGEFGLGFEGVRAQLVGCWSSMVFGQWDLRLMVMFGSVWELMGALDYLDLVVWKGSSTRVVAGVMFD